MKKLLLLLLLAAPFVFAACGDEEKEEEEVGGTVSKEALVGSWAFESITAKEVKTNAVATDIIVKGLISELPELVDVRNLGLPGTVEFTSDGHVFLGTLGEGTFSVSDNKLTIATATNTEYFTISFIDGKLAFEKDITEIVQDALTYYSNYSNITISKVVVYVNFAKVLEE